MGWHLCVTMCVLGVEVVSAMHLHGWGGLSMAVPCI